MRETSSGPYVDLRATHAFGNRRTQDRSVTPNPFLAPDLVELLRRHRARLGEERMAIGPA
jgi:hypothetical protein